MGQPLKPVGAHAAGLHTAATGIKVGFDDNAGADHVAQCAREFLNICESVHACEIAQYIKVMLSGFICRTTIQHSRRA